MNKYYLRIEGVNLDNFIFDTQDLSTIRGGSLMLIEAPEKVEKWLKEYSKTNTNIEDIKVITKGASWGLFRFNVENDAQAILVAESVREQFKKDSEYCHATFVVDVLPISGENNYTTIRKKLTALNRGRQLRSPSLAVSKLPNPDVPVKITRDNGKKVFNVCELDYVRPAASIGIFKEDEETVEKALSSSVFSRRKFGREGKRKEWYEKITGINDLPSFINDFHELAMPSAGQDFGKLNNKMAVIYVDGNGFGKLQSRVCTDEEKQKKFDLKIRTEFQAGALGYLLNVIKDDSDFKTCEKNDDGSTKPGKIRLETFLWGGDEIIWVVPAWKGWWMLGKFFEHVEKSWKFPENNPLTLAAGLVFCHYKAPIHRITRLAKDLGDMAKQDRSRNLVAYEILESFDHAGIDPKELRQRRLPRQVAFQELLLDGSHMFEIIEPMQELKQEIPKRRIHQMVHQLHQDSADVRDLNDKLAEISPACKKNLEKIKACFGAGYGPWGHWIHLLELSDYIDVAKGGA